MFTYYLSLELQRLPHCLTKEVTIFFSDVLDSSWTLSRSRGFDCWGYRDGLSMGHLKVKQFQKRWKYAMIISIFLSIGTFQDRKFLDKCWICGVWVSSRGQEDNDVSSGKVKSEEAQFILWKNIFLWHPNVQMQYKYTLILKWSIIA